MIMKNRNILQLLAFALPLLFGCVDEKVPTAVAEVEISMTSLSMIEGEIQMLTAAVIPSDADDQSIVWSSGNPLVASVTDGMVTALKAGNTQIIARNVASGKRATCSVKVNSKPVPISAISLDKTHIELEEGKKDTLKVSISPDNATNKNILWTSSDNEIAVVENGVVIAMKEGTATINAISEDGEKKASCSITVIEKPRPDPAWLNYYIQGLYEDMCVFGIGGSDMHDDYGIMSAFTNTEYMGGDIVLWGTQNWGLYDYMFDNREASNARPLQLWNTFYTLIDNSNEIIDLFSAHKTPTDPLEMAALGQAYAVRAFSSIYLMLYFQDPCDKSGEFNSDAPGVPVIFTFRDLYSQADMNPHKGRNTLGFVADQAEIDINRALALLDGYARPSKNMIDYQVAQGIAARLYLFTHQWQKAADAAKAARAGYSLMDKSRLYAGFMDIEEKEVIWGFNHTTETLTLYPSFFSHMSNDSYGYAGLNQMSKLVDVNLYNSISITDYRKAWFNDSYGDPSAAQTGATMPYASRKFGFDSQWLQDYIYMRSAEMYLTEAEAYARLGKTSKAQTVLAELMETRDPLWAKAATLDEISLQRRVELWGEGFRYFDLKRTATGIVRDYEGSNHNYELMEGTTNVPKHSKLWTFQIPKEAFEKNHPFLTYEDQNEL